LVGGISKKGVFEMEISKVTLDTTTVSTLAGTIVTALGVLWGIRKVIKLINRS